MLHLFRHQRGKLKNKFDIALVVKGRVIVFSNQGYSKIGDAVKAIQSIMTATGSDSCHYQDDTQDKPQVYYMVKNLPLKAYIISEVKTPKPHKPYLPKIKQ